MHCCARGANNFSYECRCIDSFFDRVVGVVPVAVVRMSSLAIAEKRKEFIYHNRRRATGCFLCPRRKRRLPLGVFRPVFVIAILIGFTNVFLLLPTANTNNNLQSLTPQVLLDDEPMWSSEKFLLSSPIKKPKKQNITLFYNIFMPASQPNQTTTNNKYHAFEIVEEQFEIIAKSYIATQNLTIYTNVIGPNAIQGSQQVRDLCRKYTNNENNQTTATTQMNFQCIQLNQQSPKLDGDEMDTLQSMYEYCQQQQHNDDANIVRVGYLHNKGSFHDTIQNAKLRVPLTMAVSSQSCWDPPNTTCTSCGLVFLDLPFMQFPGNFFVSRCDYIRKLLPPNKFEYHQRQLVDKAKLVFTETFATGNTATPDTDIDDSTSYQNRDSWIGIGRYASEHWGQSHPSLLPCDLSQRLQVWYRPNPFKNKNLNFHMYPRPALTLRQQNQPKINFTDYYSLKGQLYKWFYLYNQTTAPSHSWVWSRMKDGMIWKDRIYNQGPKYPNDGRGTGRGNSSNNLRHFIEKYFLASLDHE